MKSTIPPTTSTLSYFDIITNEWVTTFTIRHKVASEAKPEDNSTIPGLDALMESLKKSALEMELTCPKFELPVLIQKDIGLIS